MTDEQNQQSYPTGTLSEETILEGRYKIQRRLGKGGMGAVYLAYDNRLDILCAVKEMSTALLQTEEERERASVAFHEEAKLLARLSHPNLPRVTDHFSENDKKYLVMEYVPGDTLAQIMRRNPPPWSVQATMDFVTPLTTVLHYLHSRPQPIIFRDLKPANIIRTPDGVIKLIDFGIARLFKPGQSHDTQAFGTIGYSAPEQYGKGQTDARSDVYALGVLIHQLVTGHDPVSQPFNIPEARLINSQVPEQFSDVLATAISHDPDDRFASMPALRRALESGVTSSKPLSQPYVAHQQRPQAQQFPTVGSTPMPHSGYYQQPTPQQGITQGPYQQPTPQQGITQGPYQQSTPQRGVMQGPYQQPTPQTGFQPYPPQQQQINYGYPPQNQPMQMYAQQPMRPPVPQKKTTFLASLVRWVGILGTLATISSIPLATEIGEDVVPIVAVLMTVGFFNMFGAFVVLALQGTHQTLKGRRHATTGMLFSLAMLVLACVALSNI